jgi:acyl-CoA thioesterase
LFGGASLAAAIETAEKATSMRCRWITVQHIAPATLGATLRLAPRIVARGRTTSQVMIEGFDADRLVFTACAATAADRDHATDHEFIPIPDVPGPESCPPTVRAASDDASPPSMREVFESRLVEADARGEHLPIRIWLRARGHRATPAVIGFLSDLIPFGVWRGLRRTGTGTSLDTTVRFGAANADSSGWVLAQIEPQMSSGGYATGQVLFWSPSGALVAVASQTAILRPLRSA